MSFKVGDIVRVKDYKDIDCPNFVPNVTVDINIL